MKRTRFQKQVSEALLHAPGKLTCRKGGEVEVRDSYYYAMGRSAEGLQEQIQALLKEAGVKAELTCQDRYRFWPQLSYFQVTIRPPRPPVLDRPFLCTCCLTRRYPASNAWPVLCIGCLLAQEQGLIDRFSLPRFSSREEV